VIEMSIRTDKLAKSTFISAKRKVNVATSRSKAPIRLIISSSFSRCAACSARIERSILRIRSARSSLIVRSAGV